MYGFMVSKYRMTSKLHNWLKVTILLFFMESLKHRHLGVFLQWQYVGMLELCPQNLIWLCVSRL